jgi:hypothetical protein
MHRSDDFTKPQALRLLVHFVGDIHQSLHCGTGFYDLSDLHQPKGKTKREAHKKIRGTIVAISFSGVQEFKEFKEFRDAFLTEIARFLNSFAISTGIEIAARLV